MGKIWIEQSHFARKCGEATIYYFVTPVNNPPNCVATKVD